MLTRWANRAAAPLRGRVHKVSVVRGGEVSVVVRFGIDEPHARQLNQGTLLDIVPHTAGKLAEKVIEADRQKAPPKLGELVIKEPGEL